MTSVKILHCGDLHFDTPFRELPRTKAEQRKEDLRETFGQIITLIKKEKIPLLLISGDLFDHERIMKTTLDYLIKKFEEISETRIFISPGNHDPYTNKSFYNIVKWPHNVHIFTGNLEKVMIPELNTCVYGIGFSAPYERVSLFKNFCVENETWINIMLLHGEVVSYGQDSDYNPIYIQDIESSKLDYLALGHRHEYSGIQKSGDTFWSYPGNPEGRGFDELGNRGVVIGEVGKGFCNLTFYEICKRKYLKKAIDISGVETYEEIVKTINEAVKDEQMYRNLYKIILEGQISKEFSINVSVLEEKFTDKFYFVKFVNNTRIPIDYNALENSVSLKGVFVKKMREKLSCAEDEQEKKKLEEALRIGIQALETGEVNDKW